MAARMSVADEDAPAMPLRTLRYTALKLPDLPLSELALDHQRELRVSRHSVDR